MEGVRRRQILRVKCQDISYKFEVDHCVLRFAELRCSEGDGRDEEK